MLVVGLTGGIASGKTVVAKILRNLGAVVIDADEVGREAVLPHTECWKKLVAFFGRDIVKKDLTINRKKLADIIFNNPQQRLKLNRLTHPVIIKLIDDKLKIIKKNNPKGIVVISAALLVETGLHEKYDRVIVVTARKETQLKRLMKRDSITRKEALARINAQMPLGEKLKIADFKVTNEDDLGKTRQEVVRVFEALSFSASEQEENA